MKKFKDRLTKPNAAASLQLNKSGFALGENLEGALAITSNEEFDAREIRCEFQCIETKRTISNQYDAALKRTVPREVQESVTLWSARPQLSGPIHLTPSFSQNYQLVTIIPAAGRPTFRGVDQNVV